MSTINLSAEEIAILRSALDSAEYWEYKDELPHNSGYILDPDLMVEPPEFDDCQQEAWDAVKAIRALDARLLDLERVQKAIDEPGSYTPASWAHTDFCKTPTGHPGDCWAENNRVLGIKPGPAITVVEA